MRQGIQKEEADESDNENTTKTDYEKRKYRRKKLQIKLSPCSIRHHVITVNGGVGM
jgi:hypothetical protein